MTCCTFGDTSVFYYFLKFDRNRGIHWMHFWVIPVLGAQRLIAPKTVCFLRKMFEFIAPDNVTVSQTLDHKKHPWKSEPNREIGEALWRKNFPELHTETPWQSCWQCRQGAPRTWDRKNKKMMFNSHANLAPNWLPGHAASRIKKVWKQKLTSMCGLNRSSSNTMTYFRLAWTN